MAGERKQELIQRRKLAYDAAQRDRGSAAPAVPQPEPAPRQREFHEDVALLADAACRRAGVRLDTQGVVGLHEQRVIVDEAKTICGHCQSRTACLSFALETDMLHFSGEAAAVSPDEIRGKLTRDDRWRLLKRLNPQLDIDIDV